MPLDYHSLLTAFTLSGCGLAAAFLVSWLVSKKERFLMAWTIGVSLMALGVLIYAAYVTTMAPLLGAAGYTVLLIGLAFVFGAGREFRTRILPWRSMLAMAAGSSIVVAVPMLAGYNGIAIFVLNLAASIILFVTAWDYWLGRAEARLAITLLTALYVLTGLSFIPCAVLLAIDGRWVLSAAPSNWAEDLNIAACLATLAGIGALSLALNQARLARGHKRDAETDALTGLLNRRALLDRIAGEVVGPAALIIFDIDHFKRINDLQGHLAGDEVLRAFGEILISNRSHGLAARLGGEEFALLMPHASLVSAAIVAETVRARLAKRHFAGGAGSFGCTLSAGVARSEESIIDFDALLQDADKALYAAKHSGRDRVAVNSDEEAFLAQMRPSSDGQRGPVDLVRVKTG
ncbi:GGDEF domain-containing protein [Bosea sp. (in: a-proteobacteria)]|uniref:GGDEF domain-containing protein n=1 Tax=Bosea sp. (in: a-proteobacteria) TaxID=1871050 RepID=UPI001ACB18D5|nr:GGDEF domain-containing protein [Bosea sp. (in: a-proteobacteria)]MBN9444827.1 GGDEF domain-containing protein [Bosea sp. (in: a-proteobacteria)]